MWSPPPPPLRQAPEVYFQSVQEMAGGPTLQNSSSLKTKNPKNPTHVSDFWKLERELQNPKIELPLEFPKFQKSKNSNKNPPPRFGFLETRAGTPKSQNGAPARVSEIPKTKKPTPRFGFLETRGFWIVCLPPPSRTDRLPLEFPNIQTLGWVFWIFGISETRLGPVFFFLTLALAWCPLVPWPSGPLVLWPSGRLVFWSFGLLVPWSYGPLVLWSRGPLVLWSRGFLVPWSDFLVFISVLVFVIMIMV